MKFSETLNRRSHGSQSIFLYGLMPCLLRIWVDEPDILVSYLWICKFGPKRNRNH